MIEEKLEKVPPDHPERCNGTFRNGQCPYRAVPGSIYCAIHGGQPTLNRINRENKRSYRLQQWQARLDEFTESPTIKNLREEIGIVRMTLESIMLQCRDQTDLLIYSSKIVLMSQAIKDLIVSCDRLDTKMSLNLDKSSALNLAEQLVQIVSKYVPESDLDVIATEIGEAVITAGTITKS